LKAVFVVVFVSVTVTRLRRPFGCGFAALGSSWHARRPFKSTISNLQSAIHDSLMTTIGKAITVNGSIEAEEPLCISGTVLGNVRVVNYEVVVEADARVEGAVTGRTIIVRGRSSGRLIARELVRVHQSATVRADIAAPRLALEEGALFNGAVEPAVKANAALIVAAYRKKAD
jgi:cytoskeletal protein CcmA (bactofilin family)